MCIRDRAQYDATGETVDPHTAIGLRVAQDTAGDPAVPMIALGTAHPAKFGDAVASAIGARPVLPPRLADLMDRPERVTRLPNDLAAVQAHVRDTVAEAA